jgi:hypothetical protein
VRGFAVVLGLFAVLSAQESKISLELASRASAVAGGDLLPIFIVLAQQPPRRADLAARREMIREGQERLLASLRSGGARRTGGYTAINMVTAEVPAAMLPTLERDPAIALVFLAKTRQSADLSLSVPAMGVPAYWTVTGRTGTGATVALIDTGVRGDHPAFNGRNIADRTFLTFGALNPCFDDDAASARDQQGHGTHIAGILMGQGSPGYLDYYGVARGLTTLYNVKTAFRVRAPCNTASNGEVDDRDLIAALEWAAVNTPSRIISLSFGGPATGDGDDPFTKVVDYISDIYDAYIAVAAGNTGPGPSTITTPAIGYNVTSVANWNFREGRVISNTSSRGPTIGSRFKPDIAAPGVGIVSANVNWDATSATSDDYTSKSGTSMAAPHIAGAAALLASAGVTDPLQMKAILINTASEANWATDRGWGFVNMAAALPQPAFRDSVLLQPGGHQLYRVTGTGPLSSTITWNRHLDGPSFTPRFNNLDLYAYSLTTGAQLAASTSTIQNVEKARVPGEQGDLVVKVDTAQPNPSIEFYGIAMSRPFARATGPLLTATCEPPAAAFAGVPFAVPCTVANRGDLPAFAVSVSGVSAGAIAAGAAVTVSPTFTGATTGTGAFTANIGSNSYGEAYATSVSFTVPLSTPPPPPSAATELVSPLNTAESVAIAATVLRWNAVAGATSYDVYFGATNPPPQISTTSALSLNPAVSGSVRYFWRIVPRNAGGAGPSSPVWSFTTARSAGLYFVPLAEPCRLFEAELEAQEIREIRMRGHACVPDSAVADSVEFSVASEEAFGYLSAWPSDQPQPLTAVLTSTGKPNAAILSGESISLYASNRAVVALNVTGYFARASDGLVYYPLNQPCRAFTAGCTLPASAGAYAVDKDGAFTIAPSLEGPTPVFGYFAPAGQPGGLTFQPASPQCRILDTRLGEGPLLANVNRIILPAEECGSLPSGSVAMVNATAVGDGSAPSTLTFWATGQAKPALPSLTTREGFAVTSNAALVPTPMTVSSSASGVHLVLDFLGLFLP